MKKLIQFGLTISFLLFFLLVSLYEGSELLQNPFEWGSSTPITNLFHKEITDSEQLSSLDFFFYALKFKPTYPILVMLTAIYLIFLVGRQLVKHNNLRFRYFSILFSTLLLIIGVFSLGSTTAGAQLAAKVLLVTSMLTFGIIALQIFLPNKTNRIVRNLL
ncbi:DUF4306 domain-containing protein [Mangrovibacillus cuniculi]|uniref:DUF4306 domain-containing protein n=1 Tax=Mangrovibacillus cuniculi TaxID=2593652 RepID=A0A7S8HFQ1_9BACI|nr:DUF4306 domain-containing protein [Mangrovibacillus cuniculi]QPC46972.1 DUF4306 domain-containing protein [Mangrovibacillus cuniculi]